MHSLVLSQKPSFTACSQTDRQPGILAPSHGLSGNSFAISADSQHFLNKVCVVIIVTTKNFNFTPANKCLRESEIDSRISHFLLIWQLTQNTSNEGE